MFILDNISRVCSDPGLAMIITLIKRAVNIIWIIGPILAMVGAVIALVKMMSNPDEKKHKSLFKNMLIALVILFFLPAIINLVMNLFDDSFEFSACWNQAESVGSTGSQGSSYIDPYGDKEKTEIYTDPSEYETGEPSSSSTGSTGNTSSGSVSGSFTSTKTKIKYSVYNQADSRWSSVTYPSGSTIKDIGCMITSIAVVSSAGNSSITPKTVFDSGHRHSYPYNAINALASGSFSCTSGSTSAANIKNALLSGKVVVVKVYGSKKGGSSKFTSSQHYMALLDYDNDKIYVGNGYSSSGNGAIGWHNASAVLTSVSTADYCTPSQSLINTYN